MVFKRAINGLNLHVNQHPIVASESEHVTLTVPSDNTPAFSAHNRISIREKNFIVDSITLEITASAITGATGNVDAAYLSAVLWIQRMNLLSGTKILETHYPEQMFIDSQLDRLDAQRTYYVHG